MAAQLSRERTIAINLGAAQAALTDLSERPAQMEDYDDWSDDWVEVMARFGWVVDLAEQGKLNAEQLAWYERLLLRLRDYLPLTEQLDLRVPDEVLRAMRASESTKA